MLWLNIYLSCNYHAYEYVTFTLKIPYIYHCKWFFYLVCFPIREVQLFSEKTFICCTLFIFQTNAYYFFLGIKCILLCLYNSSASKCMINLSFSTMKANYYFCYLNWKQEDVDLMEHTGVNSYRFSLSWARILPSTYFNNNKKYNKQIKLNFIV